MAVTMVSAGSSHKSSMATAEVKSQVWESIQRLSHWLEENQYRGYDTFDGLSSPLLRPLTFETKPLRTVLLQGVRRFPINLRPLLGIRPQCSSKGMGFLARGFIRLHKATGDQVWADKAKYTLNWLIENQSAGYHGACWGNHFDYQSRGFFLPKGVPTVVWTSLIGHAFLDAYDHFGDQRYLDIVKSACHHIMVDLGVFPEAGGHCITYVPGLNSQVHNANTLGASLLARTYAYTRDEGFLNHAVKALTYTADCQRSDHSWYYGEEEKFHWVDNFHTAYVLDCFLHYSNATGDQRFTPKMMQGYDYWKRTFFLTDGTPRYYDNKTLPLDIQCSSQAIDTLVFFHSEDRESLELAANVAFWTIKNMQDRSGYFYYRRYSSRIVNKTATLHWGQATMMCALGGLYQLLQELELRG